MRIIAGTARGRTFETPPGLETRPTLDRVRESLFNILQRRMPDARVLDLFSGSGALSLEALSRGASHCVMVDHDRTAHLCEKKNIEKMGFGSRAVLLQCDWKAALQRMSGERFSLMLLDPPYAMTDLSEVTAMLLPMLSQGGMLVIEHKAGQPPLVSEGWLMTDTRKYGYCGISFFEAAPEV